MLCTTEVYYVCGRDKQKSENRQRVKNLKNIEYESSVFPLFDLILHPGRIRIFYLLNIVIFIRGIHSGVITTCIDLKITEELIHLELQGLLYSVS